MKRSRKCPTVAVKRVMALEMELTRVQDAQRQNIDKAEKSEKRATGAATQLDASVRCLAEVEACGKLATKKRAAMKLQVAR